MTTVNIVDAPCGSGKTSWAIDYMNGASKTTHRFIYITPFLEEVTRVKDAVIKRSFVEPKQQKGKTKLKDLHKLIEEGRDICTTHSLFYHTNKETRNLLKTMGYILILDEALDVISQVPLKKNSLDLLLEAEAIHIRRNKNDVDYIEWNEKKKTYDTEYNQVKRMALSGNLMYGNKSALIWSFPSEMFKVFDHVFVLTYLFKGQFQRYYFDLQKITYRYLTVANREGEYSLIPYDYRKMSHKNNLHKLINVYEGHLNDIGQKRGAFSSSWLKNAKHAQIKRLNLNAYNYLMNKVKAKSPNTIWTTIKGDKEKIKNKVQPGSYANGFVAVTQRATNEYKDRYNLAYLVNRFMNPIEKKFFQANGVVVDENTWALSELIQWVWRSRIRENKEINIFIPSKRMRDLLKKYIDSNDFEAPPINAITNEYASDWHV